MLSILIDSMSAVEQRPDFHPEGDVFTHTAMVWNRLRFLTRSTPEFAVAALLHDIGKLWTSGIHPKTGHPTHHRHPQESVRFIDEQRHALDRLFPVVDLDAVRFIVQHHHRIRQIDEMGPRRRADFDAELDRVLFARGEDTWTGRAALTTFALADDMTTEAIGDNLFDLNHFHLFLAEIRRGEILLR